MDQLTEKDLHCIARMLQSTWMAPDEEDFSNTGITTSRCFYACLYCKYSHDCNTNTKQHFKKAFRKLAELTGVVVLSTTMYAPENLEKVFLPASVFVEHPGELKYLKRYHPDKYNAFETYLKKLISDSK